MLVSSSPILVFAEEQTISVDYGKLYDINYDAKDVTIFEVIPNPDDSELIFEIDVASPNATLELTIPRDLLDSKENEKDSDFLIVADGADVTFSEKEATNTTRTLFMELSKGTTELEIFGTQLVGQVSDNEPVIDEPKEEPAQEIPQEETKEPPTVEQTPEESTPKEPSKEEVIPVVEEKLSQTMQKMFDFSKMPNWSIPINERQIQQFEMTAGAFAALVIVLIIAKGLRTEKSLS